MIRSSVVARQDFGWRPKLSPANCLRKDAKTSFGLAGLFKRTGARSKSKLISSCGAKRKTNIQIQNIQGFVNAKLMVGALLVMAGILYIYSINSTAVKGFEMKQVEKQISDLQKENDKLKIQEAELKSLYHVEEATKDLNMAEVKNVSYVEEVSPVALK